MQSIVRSNPGVETNRAHLCSEFAEAGPSPQPSKSELRSSRPREERGEGKVIDRYRLNLNASRSSNHQFTGAHFRIKCEDVHLRNTPSRLARAIIAERGVALVELLLDASAVAAERRHVGAAGLGGERQR